MKAATYVRVSSTEQVDGFSISAQLNLLQEYCQKNNIEIYKNYIEEGVSAKFSDEKKRPQFEQMLKDAEKGLFNVIVVHKYDRFARNVELSQKVKRQLKKANVNVLSMSEPIEDSPIGFFQEGILELLAEYYIRNLSNEVKKGLYERAAQGLHSGSVPYGYKIDHSVPCGMSIVPEKAEIIKLVFDMYVNQGYSLRKIAAEMCKMNVLTTENCMWTHRTVNKVLRNIKYAGKIMYDGKIFEGQHEPIIDMETFEMAQRYLQEHYVDRSPIGTNYQKYFLLGMVKCGECKAAYGIQSVKGTKNIIYNYYRCSRKGSCSNSKYYDTKGFEKYIVDYLKNKMRSKNLDGEKTIEKTDISHILSNRKNNLNSELDRAKNAYLAGAFSLEEFTAVKTRVENELAEISKPVKKDRTHLKRNIKNAYDKFKQAKTPTEKRNELKKIIDCIYVYKDRIEVIFIE